MAQRFGLWNTSVDNLYTPYIKPQENGNRSDTRWCALVNDNGVGLLAAGLTELNFSAHRYTIKDFEKTTHRHLLVPRNEIIVHLDYKVHGIGSASCGEAVLPHYIFDPKQFDFSFVLRPVKSGELRKGVRYKEIVG